jgi:hypothetical protein
MKQVFQGRLTPRGPNGAWTFLIVPFDVAAVFGSRARVPVAGTINGFPFRNSLMPEGDGTHAMMVGKDIQAGAKARSGDLVDVVMDIDRAERTVTLPEELAAALATDAQAAAAFDGLAPSHRKEYADWIGGAKKPETRVSRAQKALAMVRTRQRVK